MFYPQGYYPKLNNMKYILNDQEYLKKYMGTRKYNPDSKHHAVQLSRIKQWENRWDLLNLKR